jgi:replication-associated recombination protein RarA
MEAVIEQLMMELVVPLCHPELPRRLGVRPVAGLLLHGPPGCGKTTLAHAIANETGVPFYKISAPEVVSGVSGIFSISLHHKYGKNSDIRVDKKVLTVDLVQCWKIIKNDGNGEC